MLVGRDVRSIVFLENDVAHVPIGVRIVISITVACATNICITKEKIVT